jgi:transposase-like protein
MGMDTHIIKTDCRGRTWRSAEERRSLVEAFHGSNSSVAVFCQERGINPGTFYNWLAKERRGDVVAPTFEEVYISQPVSGREVKVCLPNRVEVLISVDSSAELAFVLREAAQCLV